MAGPEQSRTPSGLFPTGPPRPAYREPFPVRAGAAIGGGTATAVWLLLFGLLSTDLVGWAWWMLAAGGVAWLAAAALGRYGDRGVAAGVAVVAGCGLAIAAAVVAVRWASTGDWPLW